MQWTNTQTTIPASWTPHSADLPLQLQSLLMWWISAAPGYAMLLVLHEQVAGWAAVEQDPHQIELL